MVRLEKMDLVRTDLIGVIRMMSRVFMLILNQPTKMHISSGPSTFNRFCSRSNGGLTTTTNGCYGSD